MADTDRYILALYGLKDSAEHRAKLLTSPRVASHLRALSAWVDECVPILRGYLGDRPVVVDPLWLDQQVSMTVQDLDADWDSDPDSLVEERTRRIRERFGTIVYEVLPPGEPELPIPPLPPHPKKLEIL